MARARESQPLVPSVFDRLLDDNPNVREEPSRQRRQLLRDLRASVRRDLENLLNTRRPHLRWSEELSELSPSLAHYGLPDFTTHVVVTDRGRDSLRREIERTIRMYEPRFKSVHVELLKNADPADRTLRFRVDAVLYAEPAPEPAVFDSALEPSTGAFKVMGGGE